MFTAFFLLISYLPEGVSFVDSFKVAGATGRLKTVDFSIDLDNRYTIWSGILGGLFLHLAYFGTDQSQVQRYLSGRSIRESRLGLIFNALLKVPMQFFILLVGIMVFVFYQFNPSPIFFNKVGYEKLEQSAYVDDLRQLEQQQSDLFNERQDLNKQLLAAYDDEDQIRISELRTTLTANETRQTSIREEVKTLISHVDPEVETNDRDYVFITFILNHLPIGLVGLLLAVIFSAAMSSTAAELNALASTTTVDIYKRSVKSDGSETHYLRMSKVFTLFWGIFAILFACFGTLFENLIQFVNIVGSLFYGTILGIFLLAFYFKKTLGTPVFIGAVIAEIIVLIVFQFTDIGYLWYNVIGCSGVIIISHILQYLFFRRASS